MIKLKIESMKALNKYNHQNIVIELEEEIKLKNQMIEKEKEKIEKIKNNFMQNYQDKILFNEEDINNKNMKNPKYAQSVQLNDEEESKEKEELKKKIKTLKTKNDKLNQENKKLKASIEELEKSKNEVSLELYKNREDKKTFLELQVKDSKKIALLNKEKEKLKKENNKIKSDLENLKQRLHDIEQDNERLSNINNDLQNKFKDMGSGAVPIKKIEKSKIVKKGINLDEQKQNQFLLPASNIMTNADELINKLCEFVIGKNINLKKHLQRYDISKNGKIGKNDFKRAIEELKMGFINYDLEKLANACKMPNSDFISLEHFFEILKSKNENYKKFLEEYSGGNDNLIQEGDKQASRKYDNFENKEFNIDY